MHTCRIGLALLLTLPLVACDASLSEPGPQMGSEPPRASVQATGFVTAGRATDAAGQPLPDVNVEVWGKHEVGGGPISYTAVTGADGTYRQEAMAPGTYTAVAWRELSYNGRDYKLPLKPVQGEIDQEYQAKDGLSRDFVWQISGEQPAARGDEHYGGDLTVSGVDGLSRYLDLPDGTPITVTLTPDGPLMDGSAGKTLTYEVPYQQTLYLKEIEDIPLGRYTVSATAEGVGPLRLTGTGVTGTADDHYGTTATIEFLPKPSETRPYQAPAVAATSVYLRQ